MRPPAPPPPAPIAVADARIAIAAPPDAAAPISLDGAWVIPDARWIVHGATYSTHALVDIGDGRVFHDLLAIDVHDGDARTWDGRREGHARLRIDSPDKVDVEFDGSSWETELALSVRNHQDVIGDPREPRVHRYPDFAAARAVVDDDVLVQDPVKLMARLGGTVGDRRRCPI